ncbi:hypothetical protein SAMN05443574_105220 [Haloarcula vallismortis]|uniref:Uncharacterized protein n=1 Tax=Haloarcula vallismortis TaxID=28442 RepID=A0A1H2VBN9_HALVA|nr:hypothetical protein SAMN05443574_105220 [Haloarcula vallismortis]
MTKQYRFYEVFNVSLYRAVILRFRSLPANHAQSYQGQEYDWTLPDWKTARSVKGDSSIVLSPAG